MYVCMYVCVCVCVCIYIYIYTHTYIFAMGGVRSCQQPHVSASISAIIRLYSFLLRSKTIRYTKCPLLLTRCLSKILKIAILGI